MAFGCALATQGRVELDHAYYETMGIVRALRDTGLLEPARQFLDRCEKMLIQMGAHARAGHRIETMRLGLQMSELNTTDSRDSAAWAALLRAIDANLQVVMREKDELAMVLLMAVQTLHRAEGLGLECKVGVMERPERMLTLAAGAILGHRFMPGILGILFLLTLVTVLQRVYHVHRLTHSKSA